MSYKVNVVIEHDENGYYAHAPELAGCHTQGDSLDEVMENMKEATELYLETLTDEERRNLLSRHILMTSLEVEVG